MLYHVFTIITSEPDQKYDHTRFYNGDYALQEQSFLSDDTNLKLILELDGTDNSTLPGYKDRWIGYEDAYHPIIQYHIADNLKFNELSNKINAKITSIDY